MDLHSSSHFLNKDNIDTLWEVLSESPTVLSLPNTQQLQMQQHMAQQMRAFFNKEGANKSYDLMTLNKRFLELALRSMSNQTQAVPVVTSVTASPTPRYTSQQIQEARQTQFEQQYNKKKEEFTDAITLRPPPTPTFADKKDEPISEMEQLIANMVAQRNFEMDEITKRIATSAPTNPTFLKPTDTSIKTEKQEEKENVMKQIKIDNTRFIESPVPVDITRVVEPMVARNQGLVPLNKDLKRITINEELNETHYYESIAPPPKQQSDVPSQKMATSINNLFSKLKQVPTNEDPVQAQMDALGRRMDEMQKQMELIMQKIEHL
jgi:hypothetical protein